MLHSLKYHKADCLGVLIGRKGEGRTVVISDAIPLFHSRVMSGTLEIAFDMIESTLAQGDHIVGVYEAPLLGSDNLSVPTPLATNLAATIKSNGQFTEPCIVSVSAVTQRKVKEADATY